MLGGVIALVVVVLIAAFYPNGGQASGPSQAIGARMPDIALPTIGGATVDLAGLRGRWILVNVWATWCGPCRREMPALQRLSRAQSGRLVVVAVDQGEDAATVKAFVSRFGVAFPVALDGRQLLGTQLHLVGLPSSFFIDRNGIIRDAVDGEMDYDTMAQKARALLAI